MAAFGTKVVVLMMVLPSLVLLLQTSSVEAVDIKFYSGTNCDGTAVDSCLDIQVDTCCPGNGATALGISNLLSGSTGAVYAGGNCTTLIAGFLASLGTSNSGPSADACYYNYTFTGANWSYNTV